MKIFPDKLEAQLKKGLAPIYLVSGDEPLQQQEVCDSIRAAARAAGFEEREVLHADNGFNWHRLSESANSLSLFAQRRVLEVRLPDGKPGQEGSKALLEYASAPSPDNLLLLIFGKLDASAQKSKWFKQIDQAGVFVPIWPISHEQLPGWIQRRLKRVGLNATPEAVKLLAERVEGNLLAAAQEIEKLKLLCDGKHLEAEDITRAVSHSSRYDVFALTDCALRGDVVRTAKILQTLRGEGVEPPIVLWALSRELRLLATLAPRYADGHPFDRLCQQQRIWDKRKPLVKAALERHSPSALLQMLQQAQRIDLAIKGVQPLDSWDALLALALQLAGLKTPAASAPPAW